MDSRQIANRYYDAWRERAGDMTGVPLAEGFTFRGPVASFDTADGFRAMARQAGAAVRSFRVRHQFTDGDLVCSIIDWEMAMLPGTLTAAEVLQVRDGTIVRGELIYDAEDLRRAMAAPPDVARLLDRGLRDAGAVVSAVDPARWDAPSPCTAWTVRQVGNHLTGSIALLTSVAAGDPVDRADLASQKLADTDRLGPDPAASFAAVAERCVAVFARPDVLGGNFPYPAAGTPGVVLANLCLMEALVHGWDIARGARVPYQPDEAVVGVVADFAAMAIGDRERARGLFGPAYPSAPEADRLTATLAHLGRLA